MIYTDQASVENYLQTSIDASFASQFASWAGAMSRFMDGYSGRLLVDTVATTRVYDGNGMCDLTIDDVYDISAVTVDGVTVSPFTYPANSTRKNFIKLASDRFTAGNQNVSVTGIFGRFKVLPDDIKYACTVLVAGVINQTNKQTDGVKSEKIGEYTITYKDDKERADYDRAIQILNTYRKIAF